jgi:hypothetical protein
MKELIGKTVRKIFVNEGEDALLFKTDEGDVLYRTNADCCSETWFADITGLYYFRGQSVTHVEEMELPDWWERHMPDDRRTRQEYDSFYGFRLMSDRGALDIIFRNSSNGYYGGGIELGRVNEDDKFREITESDCWSAGAKKRD